MQKIVSVAVSPPFIWDTITDYTIHFQSYLDAGWTIQSVSTTIVDDSEGIDLIITVVLKK